jgi:hypothetical protein
MLLKRVIPVPPTALLSAGEHYVER